MKFGSAKDFDPNRWNRIFAFLPHHTAKRYGTGGDEYKGGRWVWLEFMERKSQGCGFLEYWVYREIGDDEFTRNGKTT